jgi:hypothetical protein
MDEKSGGLEKLDVWEIEDKKIPIISIEVKKPKKIIMKDPTAFKTNTNSHFNS